MVGTVGGGSQLRKQEEGHGRESDQHAGADKATPETAW